MSRRESCPKKRFTPNSVEIVAGLKPGRAERRRNQFVLASRTVAVRYRAWPCDAGEVPASGDRTASALCLRNNADAVRRECTNVFGQSGGGIGMERAVRLAGAGIASRFARDRPCVSIAACRIWTRADLACGFMCGFPYALAPVRPQPVAAPVPAGAPVPGKPVYATRLVARADSRFIRLKTRLAAGSDMRSRISIPAITRCGIICCRINPRAGGAFTARRVGPLFTPRRVIEALLASDIDVGPLDSYALDLMLHHEPDLAARIRIVATTDPAPIPFLVAAPDCSDRDRVGAAGRAGEFCRCVGLRGPERATLPGGVRSGQHRRLRADDAVGRRSPRGGLYPTGLIARLNHLMLMQEHQIAIA